MTPETRTHAPNRPTASAALSDGSTLDAADPPPPPPDAAPAVPGYDLRGEVGRGGMGVVYRARDSALDREVAVKVLQNRYAPDSPTARRFVDEARITAQLQHPGVPAVYHVGTLADGRPFLAMKLIKGDTLDDLLKSGAAVDPLAITEAVGQAVGYAHAHGVIHRDLKPANVMVGAFGEVQVMDWGLAKVLGAGPDRPAADDPEATTAPTEIRTLRDSDSPFTVAGSVLGTPAYMPPEQAAGELGKVDARSDVFGLGAVLCTLLTGKPPYAGKDSESVRVASLRGKTDDAFARLDGCGADPELVALCKRCLQFEPADRPATASAVADEVARLRRAADDRARQAERDKLAAEVQAAERRKRRRVATALAGLVFAAVATGGSIAGVQWRRASAGERAAETALTELRGEQGKTRAALAQVTGEQVRTRAALAREEQAAAATRVGLLGWLRQHAARDVDFSRTEADRRRDAAELARLRSLARESLTAVPAGRERAELEAEFSRLFGDILAKDGLLQFRAVPDYMTAVRLTRDLLAAEPASVPLRRQLADCLHGAATALDLYYVYFDAGAVVGSVQTAMAQSQRPTHRRNICTLMAQSIEARLSLAAEQTVTDREKLAESYMQLSHHPFADPDATDDESRPVGEALRAEEAVRADLLERASDAGHERHDLEPEYRVRLVDCLVRQAKHLLNRAHDPRAAADRLDRADALLDANLDANVTGRRDLAREVAREALLGVRCAVLAAEKAHPALAAAAKQWHAAQRGRRVRSVEPAGYLARCVALAASEPAGTAAGRAATAAGYADAALAALEELSASNNLGRTIWHAAFAPLAPYPGFRALLRKHPIPDRDRLMMAFSRAGQDPVWATAVVADLTEKDDWPGTNRYFLACIYAAASDKLPAERERYAARAVESVGRAVAAGDGGRYLNATRPGRPLGTLADRPDLRKLLAAVPRPRELTPMPRRVGR